METQHHRSNSGVKKRSSNACARCRQQKIKCSGTSPCASCSKRGLMCLFDDSAKKILVTKAYLQALEHRAEQSTVSYDAETSPRLHYQDDDPMSVEQQFDASEAQDHDPHVSNQEAEPEDLDGPENSRSSSPGTDLVNPLAIDSGNYMADYLGRHIHLGASSNWAFARRVLSTACERFGLQVPNDPIYFEGSVYELDWGVLTSGVTTTHEDLMPSFDYATYLINSAKFHCGQMFHLYDEGLFMQHFATFHGSEDGRLKVPRLWYTHYLLVIALAKLLVARNSQSDTPPAAELFLAAMKSWPDLTFGTKHVMECVEILICAALYLQCLDFRTAAFNMMGQAVRKALNQGLHTVIGHRPAEGPVVQRSRRIWWTVYVLDRQMSNLMGLPQAIRDEDVSAPLPTFKTFKDSMGFEIHVKLSRAIAEIVNTVYSTDGRLPRKFLSSAKHALQSIAKITELLSCHIEMPRNLSRGGISRFAAYLHLLNHQCICLTTRPLAYSFLDRRLQSTANESERIMPRGSAQVLLRMCINSAQQMLQILTALKNEGLLESFLPFDLEATFIASMIIIMTKTIDDSLSSDHNYWTMTAYSILDDMEARGNRIASARKIELQHLAKILSYETMSELSLDYHLQDEQPGSAFPLFTPRPERDVIEMPDHLTLDPFGQDEMTAERLREIALSLDLDGFDCIGSTLDSAST